MGIALVAAAFVRTATSSARYLHRGQSARFREWTQHASLCPDAPAPSVGLGTGRSRRRAGPPISLHGLWLLVVAVVVASYVLGAFGWLPDDPQAINVGLITRAIHPGHLLAPTFLGRDLKARLILGIQAYFLAGLLAITFPSPAEAFSVSSRGTRAAGSIRSSRTSTTSSTRSAPGADPARDRRIQPDILLLMVVVASPACR